MPESIKTRTLTDEVRQLWPELEWIADPTLREKVLRCWVRAFELSPLTPADLKQIPFTLLVPNCPTTFMEHKRCVVHIARKAAEAMREHMGNALKIDMDTVIAGAILADVGKLLEYERRDGKAVQSRAASCCAIPLPEWRWPWSAGCRTRFRTSSPPMPARATW